MCLLILTILKSVLGTLKGLKSATPFVFFFTRSMSKLCVCDKTSQQSLRNTTYSKTTRFWLGIPCAASAIRQVNNLSGIQLTVKQHDFATQCNINHFDGIENGRG